MPLPRAAFLSALLIAVPATAQTRFQDMNALERRLVVALGADIGEPGGPATAIDRRLKLAACPASVTIEPPVLGAVALRCAPLNWRIRVPIQRLAGAAQGGGTRAPREEPVVRRGDPIELIAASPGFTVSTQATADSDGAPGERIRVRPEGRNRAPVYAEVIEAGRVRLPGF